MPPPRPIRLDRPAARRFLLRALGFATPFRDPAAALDHLGYCQIDPINVCGRMHDLILRNRVAAYREGDLMRHLHGEPAARPAETRTAFEHHLPDSSVLVAFPLEAWPHLLATMRTRSRRPGAWAGRLTPRERDLAPRILDALAEQGPLSSDEIDDDRRAHRSVWGAASLAKSTLQKLFFHGRVLIAAREGNRRRYDLPSRVLPASILALPEAPAAATARWLARLKVRQRRLTALKGAELRAIEDLVARVEVEGCPALYCLRDDLPLLDATASEAAAPTGAPRLLAPLDPLIYDRRVTAALWDFDYTWEVYTPPARRQRGYYALPVLAGDRLAGHVEPRADRAGRRLQVVSRRVARGVALTGALRELAGWLGLRATAISRAARGSSAAPTEEDRAVAR